MCIYCMDAVCQLCYAGRGIDGFLVEEYPVYRIMEGEATDIKEEADWIWEVSGGSWVVDGHETSCQIAVWFIMGRAAERRA
jgi:hypothetical protein